MLFNPLIPELSVSDLSRSLQFYTEVLGFRAEYRRENHGFAFLSLGAVQLMLEQEHPEWKTGPMEPPYGRVINLQMLVDDYDGLLGSVREHGYTLFAGPEVNEYREGETIHRFHEFLVQDPDGYLLRLVQNFR